MNLKRLVLILTVFGSTLHVWGGEDEIVDLEEFIAVESALAAPGDVFPTSRPVLSVFGEHDVVDVPRSVTVITSELMERLEIDDFSDLDKLGAGTQQINYYGVPGTPILRGARGGVYFNGMQRAFQRNEMPLSFGSLEAMDLVKGPAPAHFGAGMVGGYANLIPKSPYFDRRRGSVQLAIGSEDEYRAQVDAGGPLLLGDRPAAYRVSITAQDAGSYYDGINNDFVSLYGAVKSQLAKNVSFFNAAEYFRFRSNENPGWNRPTQDLIDRGEYIIGEPLSIVSDAWGGVANRNLLGIAPALVVPADVVNSAVSAGQISDAQRSALLDLSEAAQRATAYRDFSAEQMADLAPTTSGFLYTPEYFSAGGNVFTTPIRGSVVLTDANDYANSENLLYYAELQNLRNPELGLETQLLVDWIQTDKLSTYGYAISTEQLLFEVKTTATQSFPVLEGMDLTYGLSARHTDAQMLQDFFAEPFSRRDITRPDVSPNSVILAGPQTGPDGRNFWSPTAQGGANAHSKLWQFSGFAYAANHLLPRLSTYTSLLVAHAPYRTVYPPAVDLVPPDDPRRIPRSDHRNYYSASFSPVWTVAERVNLYATLQSGTAIDPLQGGAIIGSGNFARNKLTEVGVKAALADHRLYAALSVFDWKQSQYDQRVNNTELLHGDGAELEFTLIPDRRLSIIGSLNHQRVFRDRAFWFRSQPLTAEQWALRGGVLNAAFETTAPAANPRLEYPGTPETQAKLFAIVAAPQGFGFSLGAIWSDAFWHNFDHTLRLPSSLVWNGSVFYRNEDYEVALSLANLTDEDHFRGAEPVFGANTLLTKAPGRSARFSFTWKY